MIVRDEMPAGSSCQKMRKTETADNRQRQRLRTAEPSGPRCVAVECEDDEDAETEADR